MEEFSVENLGFEKGGDEESNGNRTKTFSNDHHQDYKKCGWLCFQPLFLQKFRTAKWVLFWLCWAGAVQGKKKVFIEKKRLWK